MKDRFWGSHMITAKNRKGEMQSKREIRGERMKNFSI
jgi:hypothetical protein